MILNLSIVIVNQFHFCGPSCILFIATWVVFVSFKSLEGVLYIYKDI